MASANPGIGRGAPQEFNFGKPQFVYSERRFGADLTSGMMNTMPPSRSIPFALEQPRAPCQFCGKLDRCLDRCPAQLKPNIPQGYSLATTLEPPQHDPVYFLVGTRLESNGNIFLIERLIGRGTFGLVYQAAETRSRVKFATKVITNQPEGTVPWMKNELKIMAALHDEPTGYFPHVEAILSSEKHEFIVMEMLTISLEERFQYAPPSILQLRCVFRQMLCALVRLRGLGICHFDVKAGNIMFDANGQAKLIDFSCAYFDRDVVPKMIITATSCIRAPEVLLRYRISHEADMWSLGIAMLTLYLHRAPCFAAIEQVWPKHHEWYMLTSLEHTIGPVPQHLLEESVERERFYTTTPAGHYRLMHYKNSAGVKGCRITKLVPYFVAERAHIDHANYDEDRENFLDLMEKIFVYENRISAQDALCHPFYRETSEWRNPNRNFATAKQFL